MFASTFFSCPEYVLMTYQLYTFVLAQEGVELLDEPHRDLVDDRDVRREDARHDADDQRAGCDLLTRGPLHLAQLAPRLTQEFPRAGALPRGGHVATRTAGPACARGLCHDQRVSLCAVCLPHQRQYLENSTRSGS